MSNLSYEDALSFFVEQGIHLDQDQLQNLKEGLVQDVKNNVNYNQMNRANIQATKAQQRNQMTLSNQNRVMRNNLAQDRANRVQDKANVQVAKAQAKAQVAQAKAQAKINQNNMAQKYSLSNQANLASQQRAQNKAAIAQQKINQRNDNADNELARKGSAKIAKATINSTTKNAKNGQPYYQSLQQVSTKTPRVNNQQ